MSWLIRDGDVLAAIDERRSAAIAGAFVRSAPSLVHTMRPAVDLDVAWCARTDDEGLEVRRIRCVKAHRVAVPHLGSGALIEAPAGSFERWRLQVGDRVEIREA